MNGNCDGILADAMIGVRYFTNLTRIDSNGTLVCSAMPLAKGIKRQDSRLCRRQIGARSGGRTESDQPASGQPGDRGPSLPLHNAGRQF